MALSLFDVFEADPAPPEIEIRPYQRKAIDNVLAAKDRGLSRVLVVAATGTGKTTIFSTLLRELHDRGENGALVLAHREELLQQAAARIRSVGGLRAGIERAEEKAHPDSQVVVGSVQTLGRPNSERLPWFRPRAMIVDEAHHACADSYLHVLRRFGSFKGDCFTVGFTATAHRMDNKPLHGDEESLFEECVFTYDIMDAIADGHLVDIRAYQVRSGIDISKVKTTAGDFNQKELAKAVDDEKRDAAMMKHWLEVARERSTMVFCASVDHAYHVRDLYRAHGITAEAVDGTTDHELRRSITERFQAGDVQVLCNMAVFTEGFDAPRCSCIVMLRPTKSWTVFVQAAGRGLRPFPGKSDCIVIDVTDNSGHHSLASVPGMVGLPNHLDLNGHTITEAKTKIAAAGGRAATLSVPRETRQVELVKFEDLDTVLSAVNLLAEIKPPEDVAKVSKFMWLPLPGGALHLSAGAERSATLTEDALGCWTLRLRVGSAVVFEQEGMAYTAAEAVRRADPLIQAKWKDAAVLASSGATWRKAPISESQLKYLRRLRVNEDTIAQLKDRGEASALIDTLTRRDA